MTGPMNRFDDLAAGRLGASCPERPPADSPHDALRRLVRGWSLEVTPRTAEGLTSRPPPAGTQIYITHLPGHPFEEVIATAERLKTQGYDPIPHLVARAIPDRDTLESWLLGLTHRAGIDAVLLLAGSLAAPHGPYADSLALLETVDLRDHGIHRLAMAGHPEGHPQAATASLDAALATKRDYAARHGLEPWLVTQFLFDAEPLLAWRARLGALDLDLPIRAGLPGPASLATLWKYALSCGVGASRAALAQQGKRLFKLARPQPPTRQVLALAEAAADDLSLHFYPFGGIAATLDWVEALDEGHFRLTQGTSGPRIDID
ncbi:methylenetetrahydrofolate reductase [Halomonas sp. 328]|uniref:hypothetical protein n=1 Tax=Halomonas sp. 328 TaxID=2776704 RepID=UPI0018A755B0|nr:hypothetical protein [Halomonas sp. 328]MBF8224279.1 hypothetical protein [Halomonas sp. 328]